MTRDALNTHTQTHFSFGQTSILAGKKILRVDTTLDAYNERDGTEWKNDPDRKLVRKEIHWTEMNALLLCWR